MSSKKEYLTRSKGKEIAEKEYRGFRPPYRNPKVIGSKSLQELEQLFSQKSGSEVKNRSDKSDDVSVLELVTENRVNRVETGESTERGDERKVDAMANTTLHEVLNATKTSAPLAETFRMFSTPNMSRVDIKTLVFKISDVRGMTLMNNLVIEN
ncbi:uncharacterized protein LOC123007428 [Tribolium madens]|uniref:uncharacterized protein LOC123007428 n=1 Tax=Tribolium madens TaxID=41895 RepID=UPI001CF76690|nr:uncharacterized protein LOC123007428 [Tribolium madens]